MVVWTWWFMYLTYWMSCMLVCTLDLFLTQWVMLGLGSPAVDTYGVVLIYKSKLDFTHWFHHQMDVLYMIRPYCAFRYIPCSDMVVFTVFHSLCVVELRTFAPSSHWKVDYCCAINSQSNHVYALSLSERKQWAEGLKWEWLCWMCLNETEKITETFSNYLNVVATINTQPTSQTCVGKHRQPRMADHSSRSLLLGSA